MNIIQKITFLFCLCAVLFTACKKDLGNYEYSNINSLEISNIQDKYNVEIGSTPNIKPELAFSKDAEYKEENYSFEWITFKKGEAYSSLQRQLIHTGKDLDISVQLGLGEYNAYYRVKEKSTGILWTYKFDIEVIGNIKGGWAVLSEVNHNAQLDYFEYDFATNTFPKEFRDFPSYFMDSETGTQFQLQGKPLFIEGIVNTTASTGTNKYLLYIGTDQKTSKINVTDGFVWKEKYNFEFETLNAAELPILEKLAPLTNNLAYAYHNGALHKRYSVFNVNFGNPINTVGGQIVPIAPYIVTDRINSSRAAALVYDSKGKRFLRSLSNTTELSGNLPTTNANFNPNDAGMDLVWMGHTNFLGQNVGAFAVMTKDNKYFLVRISNYSATIDNTYFEEITTLPGISDAKYFEVDQMFGYLQYAVGGKLYQYSPDTKEVKLMKDYGNREITLLKHNKGNYVTYATASATANAATAGKRFLPVIKSLIVATYDPANPSDSGQVDFFEAPQFNADYNLYYSFDKIGKVKDVACVEFPTGY